MDRRQLKKSVLENTKTQQGIWLALVMVANGLNEARLAEELHITRQAVSCWICGRTPLAYTAIYTICHKYDVRMNPDKLYQQFLRESQQKQRA